MSTKIPQKVTLSKVSPTELITNAFLNTNADFDSDFKLFKQKYKKVTSNINKAYLLRASSTEFVQFSLTNVSGNLHNGKIDNFPDIFICGKYKHKVQHIQPSDLLFIGGLNTYNTNTYELIYSCFNKQQNLNLHKIDYKPDENIDTICDKIKSKVESINFKYIVLHSMGAFLFTKFLHDIKNTQSIFNKLSNTKFIFLNPMFDKLDYLTFFHKLTPSCLSNYTYSPKILSIPFSKLDNQSTFFSDLSKPESYSMLLYKQLYESYEYPEFADFDNFISIYDKLNQTLNLSIIYSAYDEIATIKPENLNKLQSKYKLYTVFGKHEPFNLSNTKELQDNFFKILEQLLK